MAVRRTTLKGLPNVLAEVYANLQVGVSKVSDETAIAVVKELAESTPVDTSKAISNWQVKINKEITTPIEAHVPGMQGSTRDQSVNVTVAAAYAALAQKQSIVGRILTKFFKTAPKREIHIGNVLPYISRLNEGYSNQAPSGFVERAVMVGRQKAIKESSRIRVL